jgi:hypothetical protein
MQKSSKHILFSSIFIIFYFIASAQENYRVVNWNMEHGLSNGFIRCMIKDINGFLWIGTQAGLDRFDGYSFKIYLPEENNPKSVLSKNIRGLIEDSLHHIWIGTDEGLSRYDIQADTFTNFLPQVDTPGSNNSMIPFWASGDELFCLEALSKITIYNIHSLSKINTVPLPYQIIENIRNQDLIYEEGSNAVWRLSDSRNDLKGGLHRLSLSNGREDVFDWPCFKNISHDFHWAEAMCYDRRRNSIWINSTDGLVQFMLRDKKFHFIKANKDLDGRGAGINMDMMGRVWKGTEDKGIFIYDPESGTASIPFPDDSLVQWKINHMNLRIYSDRDNMAWVVYWPQKGLGINQLIPYSPAAKRYSHDDKISVSDQSAVNTHSISKKDIKGTDKKKENDFLSIDTSGRKAWLVENKTGNLLLEDIPARQCSPIKIINGSGQIISHVVPKGIYFGLFSRQFRENHIFWGAKADKSDALFLLYKDSAVAREILPLPNVRITNMIVDDDHIYIKTLNKATTNLIYVYMNGGFTRLRIPLDTVAWTAIVSDRRDSSWWIAKDRKLLHFQHNFSQIYTYSAEGIVPPGNDIFNLLIDTHGNIWFNTNHSLARLSPATGKIISLSEKDGFQPQQYNIFTSYATKARAGDFFMSGGYQGLDYIRPDKVRETYPPSFVYIRSLEVNQKSLPLETNINNLQNLSLTHSQNKINIETGIIDYYSNGKSNIRYKLDGRDSNWQYGTYYNTIRYEGLPPGTYKLVIQASNAIQEYNGPAKIMLIRISPAFWTALWFRIGAAFCIIASFSAFARWRFREKYRLQLMNSEKEKEFAEMRQKTAELQQQAVELEMQALRAQMNPHFIFNSLNSINRFIMQNNKTQASEYLTKFSKLVRLILQNSQATLISLESELESLKLYLDLEALRFDYRFGYKISVAPDLDITMLKIPPLIIQPFAENAIWHGLMHKEDKGQLDIEVFQENEYLIIKIADDGVGRKQSEALGSKSATLHKSMGLRITADRIAMFHHSVAKESPVTIHDLVNPDGSAAGTEVIIKMKTIYDQ